MKLGPIGVLLEGGMNFGKFAMKLRYGQVAMKILRYGPIGKFGPSRPRPARQYKKEGLKPLPFIPLPFLHNNHHNLVQDDLIDKTHFRNRGNPIQPQKQDTLSF